MVYITNLSFKVSHTDSIDKQRENEFYYMNLKKPNNIRLKSCYLYLAEQRGFLPRSKTENRKKITYKKKARETKIQVVINIIYRQWDKYPSFATG